MTEEIKNIAPNLYQIKKLGTGFSLPKNYFNSVEKNIENKLNINNSNPFSTPKNYFDTIQNKVLNKIKIEETENKFTIPQGYFDSIEENVFKKLNNKPKVITLHSKVLKLLIPVSVAASILLIFSLSFIENNNTKQDLLATIKTTEIENWLDNGYIDINTFDIASTYSDSDLENIELENTLDEENLINYLDDIDVESLILTD